MFHVYSQAVSRLLLERLLSRLQEAMQRLPLDLDYLYFICTNDLGLITSHTSREHVPQEVMQCLSNQCVMFFLITWTQDVPLPLL